MCLTQAWCSLCPAGLVKYVRDRADTSEGTTRELTVADCSDTHCDLVAEESARQDKI